MKTSVIEYINLLYERLGELSLEETEYSDYDEMTNWLEEIEKEVKRLEKRDEPVDCLEDLLNFTHFNARESYQEVANLVFGYLDAKGVNHHLTNTCEWCNGQFHYMVIGHDEKGDCYQVELEHKHCPNCGRAIDWSEE